MKRVVVPLASLALAAAALHAQVTPARACVPAPNEWVTERAELIIAGPRSAIWCLSDCT